MLSKFPIVAVVVESAEFVCFVIQDVVMFSVVRSVALQIQPDWTEVPEKAMTILLNPPVPTLIVNEQLPLPLAMVAPTPVPIVGFAPVQTMCVWLSSELQFTELGDEPPMGPGAENGTSPTAIARNAGPPAVANSACVVVVSAEIVLVA